MIIKGTLVLSNDKKHFGHATGSTHRCQMGGCNGQRVAVKWEDKKITYPCSKGLQWDQKRDAYIIM